jgi:excisionase family DNA binding protein
MTSSDSPRTFAVSVGAERLGVTVDWYMRQLRARKLPGHKIGRQWRLTDEDVEEALRITARPAIETPPDPAGLTPGSRRRVGPRMPGQTKRR